MDDSFFAFSLVFLVFFFGVGADFWIFWISALFREIREVSQVKKHFVGHPFIFLFFCFFGGSLTLWRLVLGVLGLQSGSRADIKSLGIVFRGASHGRSPEASF